jgi:hypothetical protein
LGWHTRINGKRTTERRKERVSKCVAVYTSEKKWVDFTTGAEGTYP